jgi:hypothetical protein
MPAEQQIRDRALRLWREAGEPEGRNAEFWRRAEQQLAREDLKGEGLKKGLKREDLKRDDLAAPPDLPDADATG